MWDGIILHRWSLGMDKEYYATLYNGINYLSMLRLKLNHISKRGPMCLLVGIWSLLGRGRAILAVNIFFTRDIFHFD